MYASHGVSLEALAIRGLVREGASDGWQVAEAGLADVLPCRVLRGNPELALRVRPDVQVHDYTVYDLITHLTGKGWAMLRPVPGELLARRMKWEVSCSGSRYPAPEA